MLRVILAVGLLLTLASEAFAQDAAAPPPKLRELVTVTDELVRIGDLVSDAGAAAGIAVFRAPDLGQTGTVPVARVVEALRRHDVNGIDIGELSEVIVTRLSRAISAADLRERIVRAVAGKYGFGGAGGLGVTFDRDVRTLHLEATATAELIIARMNVDPRSGRFDVSFDVPGSALARRLPLRFAGVVAETLDVAVLTRAIARGDVLRESDIVAERRPRTEVGGDAADIKQAIGKSARIALRAGQPLRAADLVKPIAVQRNEPVTIMFEIPGITLTVRGKALEPGAVGDVIGVLNIQSNRSLQATIGGPGRVTIAAIPPRLAAATAAAAAAPADQIAPQSAE